MSTFVHKNERPADILERVQSMLTFVRSWVDAEKHWVLDDDEWNGLSYTLDAVKALLEDARAKMACEIVIYSVPGMTIVVQPDDGTAEKTAQGTDEIPSV